MRPSLTSPGSWEAWIQVEGDIRAHMQVNYQTKLGNLQNVDYMWLDGNPLNATAVWTVTDCCSERPLNASYRSHSWMPPRALLVLINGGRGRRFNLTGLVFLLLYFALCSPFE